MKETDQRAKPFPPAPPLRKLIGPSFLLLALGLGSGEIILWPSLTADYGLGIAWGALLGIGFQYFMNMEIERYALVKGESVFVGIAKMLRAAPYWFIVSTFIGFGLPGIVASSAYVLGSLFDVADHRWLAMGMLVVIGVILSFGKTLYGLMEKLTTTVLLIGVPAILVLALVLADGSDWLALARGMVGQGGGYDFFPMGLAVATFFAAFGYSGSGGNLNLTQSVYIKEKGYGMGKYAKRLAGFFSGGATSATHLEGVPFEDTPTARQNFADWWRRVSWEHGIVFLAMGAVSMLLLMLLSYVTAFGGAHSTGIAFVIEEGASIAARLGPAIGAAFLFVIGVLLFQTQLTVMDSTSRIISENVVLARAKGKTAHLAKTYFAFLWAQIVFGIVLFLLNIAEPKFLLVLGACLNAFAMFIHIGLVSILNYHALPRFAQLRLWRRVILAAMFVIFGIFSAVVLVDQLA